MLAILDIILNFDTLEKENVFIGFLDIEHIHTLRLVHFYIICYQDRPIQYFNIMAAIFPNSRWVH